MVDLIVGGVTCSLGIKKFRKLNKVNFKAFLQSLDDPDWLRAGLQVFLLKAFELL